MEVRTKEVIPARIDLTKSASRFGELRGYTYNLSMEMSRLTRDGTAELVSRGQILRHEQREQGNIIFPCSADHEQDWQPYAVDPYSCYMCNDTYTT